MRWGLIGASTIAAEHVIGAIRAQPGGVVASVLSADPARGAAFAATHRIAKAHSDLAAFLAQDDLDAVYISTTNEKHRDQALAALASGKHVLCEKPLAMTLDCAGKMLRAARDAGRVLATNHHLRAAGSHQAIRQAVTSGRIGTPLSMRIFHAVHLPAHLQGWRLDDPRAGGGVILDITVHDADIARFHLGEDPVRVTAMAQAAGMGKGVEDSAMSIWSLPSGVMVQSHESFTHRHAATGLEIHGTEGSILARGVMTQRPLGEVVLRHATRGEEPLPFASHDLYAGTLARFHAAAAGQGRPLADGLDGFKSLAVALGVAQSARTGQSCAIDYSGA